MGKGAGKATMGVRAAVCGRCCAKGVALLRVSWGMAEGSWGGEWVVFAFRVLGELRGGVGGGGVGRGSLRALEALVFRVRRSLGLDWGCKRR